MSLESRNILNEQIKNIFAPILRADGFKGSGRTFRRVRGELIHVVNIQNYRYGGMFAVNLGVNLTFLLDSIGKQVDVKNITEPLCEFRRRMTNGVTDQWWSYKDNFKSIHKAVSDMIKVYENCGRKQLETFRYYPQDFAFVDVNYLKSDYIDFGGFWNTRVRYALTFALIRQYENNFNEAIEFAEYGLEILGQATGLRKYFEKIISDCKLSK
ncbi:MAG TPA: DUF4304 domain-containing protein [Pyrinomonadaceae bacterium]|nr:DUF4304 domain-containing protein [Pyrinomonadaceae bacterium]